MDLLPLILQGIGITSPIGLGAWAIYKLFKRKIRKNNTLTDDYNSLKRSADTLQKDFKGGRESAEADRPRTLPQLPSRKVDEINQLLQLRKLEGRDSLLDAAFGMFAEDELQKRIKGIEGHKNCKECAQEILRAIEDRIRQAAPLSYTSENVEE